MVRIIKTLEGKIASLKFYGKVISQVKMGEKAIRNYLINIVGSKKNGQPKATR